MDNNRIDCDHDTLIKLNAGQEHLCKKLDKLEGKLDKIIEIANRKVSWKPLLASIGIAVSIISSVIGYNYFIDGKQWGLIDKNKEHIAENAAKIGVLQYAVDKDKRHE